MHFRWSMILNQFQVNTIQTSRLISEMDSLTGEWKGPKLFHRYTITIYMLVCKCKYSHLMYISFVYLSYLFVHVFIYLYLCMYLFISLLIYLSIYLFIYNNIMTVHCRWYIQTIVCHVFVDSRVQFIQVIVYNVDPPMDFEMHFGSAIRLSCLRLNISCFRFSSNYLQLLPSSYTTWDGTSLY